MPWLSLPEYARRTGTPQSTVRVMIRAGRLEAHREARAPGDPRDVWKVWLDDPPEPATEASSEHPQPSAVSEPAQAPPPAVEPPADTAWLQGKLDERDETIAALYAANADLREERGRLLAESESRAEALEWTEVRRQRAEEEAERLRDHAADLASQLAADRQELARLRATRRWWRWWA